MVQLDLNKIVCLTVLVIISLLGHSQDPVTLQFTGQDQYGQHVPLSTVTVENVTKHWQEMLYYPDTVLFIGPVGIHDPQSEGKGVRLFQNVPNPFNGMTDFVLHLPEASAVTLEICDVNGNVTAAYTGSLDQGDNCFRAWLSSPQTYLLSARTDGGTVQIKMMNAGSAGQNRIEYLGNGETFPMAKSDDNAKGSTNLPFTFGDWMMYQGYANLAGTEFESVSVERQQYGSELITLTFSLPLPTVTTEAATDISATEAKLNGIVEEYAGYPIVERGFLFADNASLDGAVEHMAGSGAGLFYCVIANLQIATRYYFRAYAKTEIGTTYGDVLFLDTQAELPSVLTLGVTDVKSSQAIVTGNVTSTGGVPSLVRGFCWSTAQNPTVNDSHTSDIGGDGSFTSSITGLSASTIYYVRAYATNSTGTVYGVELTFTTQPPFYCGIDTVTDYDGNVYSTIEIGQQCWLKENLRTTHYADGAIIPVGTEVSETTAYRYYPYDNSANVPIYGYLYNWTAVMHGAASSSANPSGVQGICPDGWHVPSEAELMQLINFVSSQSQYGCGGDNSNIVKALSSAMGWECVSTNNVCYPDFDISLNNATGFSAIPIGYVSCEFSFVNFRTSCEIRSSTEHFNYGAHGAATLSIGYDGIHIHPLSVCHATSVRCLLDDSGVDSSIAVTPLVTTAKIEDITSMSAKVGGFVSGSGGTQVTDRGLCWNTVSNPTVSDSHTTDGHGTGGFTSGIAGLVPGTTYYIRAYATNSAGTAYGEQRVFTTTHPINDSILIDAQTCPGADTVTDYDGNIYRTVQIGNQCWMRENLRTTHYADGTEIPAGNTTSNTTAYRYPPHGHESEVTIYGYLYNWIAVMHGDSASNANPSGVQGICPTSWHVPSRAEWTQLQDYVGSQSQYVCDGNSTKIAKALASHIWCNYLATDPCNVAYEVSTNNATGFSALPAGYYPGTPLYSETNIWSSDLWAINLSSIASFTYFRGYDSSWGCSVRCLRDDSSAIVIPSVTTDTLRDIFFSSATCGGFVIESGSSPVSARGVCWSTSHNPTVNDSHTTNGSGTGSFTSHIDSLYANTTYYVRAYATNSVGTAYGEERSFTTLPTFYCGIDSVTDYDGNVYPTVEIGQQCWMRENLRTTHYADGTEILVGNPNSTYPTIPTTPYRCAPGNNNANVPVYGLLYNGYAACGSAVTNFFQGVCPDGWHLPSQNEYEQLTSYVGNQSQYVCGGSSIAKSLASPSGWIGTSSNTCSVKYCPDENNATGFTAVPAGANSNGLGDSCIIWSRSMDGFKLKSFVVVDQTVILKSFTASNRFLSVRCLHNEIWIDSADLVVPCVTTDTSSNILSTSATCGGFVSGSGGSSVTARGVCWSTSHNPTVNDSHTSEGSGTGRFSSNISGLATGTTYYVRAYATNSVGTAYGEERSFTTETSSVAPTQ